MRIYVIHVGSSGTSDLSIRLGRSSVRYDSSLSMFSNELEWVRVELFCGLYDGNPCLLVFSAVSGYKISTGCRRHVTKEIDGRTRQSFVGSLRELTPSLHRFDQVST